MTSYDSTIRQVAFAAGILALVFALVVSPRVWAGTTHSSSLNSSTSSSCVNGTANAGVRPSPYTGGAGVSRVFYPADGSTVTVTTTGAVIKQSSCGTPYREGWVNTADMNCVNTYSDLSGRIRSGASNPYVNSSSTCNTQTSTTNPSLPATTTTTTSTSVSKPVVAAATTTATSNNTGKATQLPNTGPGGVLALGGISSILGGIGHYAYRVRRNKLA